MPMSRLTLVLEDHHGSSDIERSEREKSKGLFPPISPPPCFDRILLPAQVEYRQDGKVDLALSRMPPFAKSETAILQQLAKGGDCQEAILSLHNKNIRPRILAEKEHGKDKPISGRPER
eukprot:763616-Hanusia_phi.AAC.1